VPKYLRGYHKCSADEASQLAAYIYRVRFGDDTGFLENRRYGMFSTAFALIKSCIRMCLCT